MQVEDISYGLSENDIYNGIITILKQFFDGDISYGEQSTQQQNSNNYILLTITNNQTKSLPGIRYQPSGADGVMSIRCSQLVKCQIDIYGTNAMQIKDLIVVCGQSVESFDFQVEHTPNIRIITIEDRGNHSKTNDQQKYESKYTVDMELSIFNEIKSKTQFTNSLNLETIRIK